MDVGGKIPKVKGTRLHTVEDPVPSRPLPSKLHAGGDHRCQLVSSKGLAVLTEVLLSHPSSRCPAASRVPKNFTGSRVCIQDSR